MNDLAAPWERRVESDLTPFADPGTQVIVTRGGRVIEALWHQRSEQLTARFVVQLDGVKVEAFGKSFTYSSFFASEYMADLLGLAKMILQAARPAIYVETLAQAVDEAASSKDGNAAELVRTQLSDIRQSDATIVVMITGEAGAGKTTVLKHLVKEQADRYIRGQSAFLFLYIDAQGRALARFNEALATELSDLRSRLTYHAVSTLVRLGALVPVIDGFDELIGVGGYDDAFNSISAFVEELDGEGGLVASARSTYYEQEFISRANSASSLGAQAWRLRSVRINAWKDSERAAYVAAFAQQRGISTTALANAVESAFAGDGSGLGTKPLFVAKVVDLVAQGESIPAGQDLLKALAQLFVARECGKLRSKSGRPMLSTEELTSLLSEVAEEMWNQARRDLDKVSARELAELSLLDKDLPRGDAQVVVERISTFAFLRPGEAPGTITFEHELFFAYFLGLRLSERLLESSPALTVLLGRSVLPAELAVYVIDALSLQEHPERTRLVVDHVCSAATSKSLRQAQVKENSGALIAALLSDLTDRETPCFDLYFHGVVFPGQSLARTSFRRCSFSSVEFRRTNLCGTRFSECLFDGVSLTSVLVDHSTCFDVGGLKGFVYVSGLRVVDSGGDVTEYFDPREVQKELVARGVKGDAHEQALSIRTIDQQIVLLLEKFSRAYQKRNPVCEGDSFLTQIFSDPQWPRLRRALLASGVVTEESRSAHGPRRTFLRRQVPQEEMMLGIDRGSSVSEPVRRLWDALES